MSHQFKQQFIGTIFEFITLAKIAFPNHSYEIFSILKNVLIALQHRNLLRYSLKAKVQGTHCLSAISTSSLAYVRHNLVIVYIARRWLVILLLRTDGTRPPDHKFVQGRKLTTNIERRIYKVFLVGRKR